MSTTKRRLLILLSAGLVAVLTTGMFLPHRRAAFRGGQLLFFCNWNDAAERAKDSVIAVDMVDDYATSPAPLEGAASLYHADTDTNYNWTSVTFSDNSAAVIYARVMFRVVTPQPGGVETPRIILLDGSGNTIARASLRGLGDGTYYRIYAWMEAANGQTSFTASTFSDANYWLYVTYTKGTNVVAAVKDASLTNVAVKTTTGTTTTAIASVNIYSDETVIFDRLEVRTDTDWEK